ncbi:phosphatase PAP2 family protein [Paenibacillus sp. MMS18-CY102]|uniref:phosphatase PAP2 family protein n=1 Tax=Paenibacillus sp. MMS18-CY102 TaxID=2682849 RepID=UPI0013664AA2|nr:phosphatase PAP2 family protein [Paenibacillus sp. MMS18-CY102]MWC29054.1 phosphatase PAP2 family protein [Paenibacillus sp. MMS18-CY102]
MERMMGWLRTQDRQLLLFANRRSANRWIQACLGRWLSTATHMGGATFTLATGLLIAISSSSSLWRAAGWQCLVAVALSHLPVAIMKRRFRRLRPYQKLPFIHACRSPLKDSSFPSGHTTAIFAWLLPITLAEGASATYTIPAALLVGLSVAWSRMYLGLHYPSDVMAGFLLGTTTSAIIVLNWPL